MQGVAFLRTAWSNRAAVARAAGRLGSAAIGLVYPPACIACGGATGEAHALCAACWRELRFIERPFCERLGTPFPLDLGPALLSPAAIADPPVFERARAVACYDDTARRVVHRLKYSDRLDLARALGGMMARSGAELARDADVIVPVPLHRTRLWWRRFNQSMALARVVARTHAKPCEPDLLLRVKRTKPQVGLSRNERGENLQGAFRVPVAAKPRLAGRRVLLVDDVLTTGATANAASRALLRGGAAAVDVLAFARVVPES
jgi:ComF family protein